MSPTESRFTLSCAALRATLVTLARSRYMLPNWSRMIGGITSARCAEATNRPKVEHSGYNCKLKELSRRSI